MIINKKRNIFIITIIVILSILIGWGIVSILNVTYRMNNSKIKENFVAQNKILLGEESVFYVDLTKKNDDHEKIIQKEEKSFNKKQQTSKNMLVSNQEHTTSNTSVSNQEQNNNEDNKAESETEQLRTLLVKVKDITKLNNAGKVQSIVKMSDNIYCFNYSNEEESKEGYNNLKSDDLVEDVCLDEKITILENDIEEEDKIKTEEVSAHHHVWGTKATGLTHYLNKINYMENAPEIRVALLDTGVRITHEVFQNKEQSDRIYLEGAYNYVSQDADISDDNGHGTMVAGIIAESTSSNIKIVPIKIMDKDGEGILSNMLQAVTAIKDKVDVINLSLGIDENSISDEAKNMAEEVLKGVYDSSKLVICASGNKGEENVYYPASSKYTIAVSALNMENTIASFSNYGDTVDFSAPGQGLILPHYTGDNIYNSSFDKTSKEYKRNSGTSFAAPFITSAIALIQSENKDLKIEQIKDILKDNSVDLGATGKDKYYGYGSIDFNSNMFKTPVIANLKIEQISDNSKKIIVNVVCANKITNWYYNITGNEPGESEWKEISSPTENFKATILTNRNEDYYIWFKDEKGNTVKKIVNLKKESSEEPKKIKLGDVNQDDKINTGDVLLLLRHIAQENNVNTFNKHPTWKLTQEQIAIGDVTKNNKIDTGDVLKLLRYIAASQNETTYNQHKEWLILE